jgi:Spy/CpxP family protein refolding chaperone
MSGIQSTPSQVTNQTQSSPFANLGLSSQQQTQLQQILSQVKSGTLTPSQAQSQVDTLLTPQQQQALETDRQTARAHHHHHDGSSSGSNPLSQLGLSSSQQAQISQIVQNGQSSGTSPNEVLTQINNVLTASQQQQLASLFASASAYTSSGSATTAATPSILVNTNA